MSTPTSDIDESAQRIGSKAELTESLEAGCKPRDEWRIGTEHEKFGFFAKTLEPVPYEGEASIRSLLEQIGEEYAWTPIIESGNIIGLKRDGASISLEPGGQFELSGAPLETIHQTCAEIDRHLTETETVAQRLGIEFLAAGSSPIWSMDDTPMMPKARYGIMTRYMKQVGRLGREMMFRTCTVQSNLDFESESDMRTKMRVALALQPIVTALFANSPFTDGRPNGYQSYRSHIWTDTDPDRSGMLPFAFEEGFGFEQYVAYALDVPMYFVRRKGEYLDCAGRSFRDFMNGDLPELPGERPTIEDFNDHLSTIFPEVRLKTFLEMRGADAGPQPTLCALSALWAGLLYDATAQDEALQLIKDWSAADRESLRRSVPAMGLSAPINGRNALEVARDTLAIARSGLKRRARLNAAGDNETIFLGVLDEIAETGRNQATRLLELYNTEWGRDLRPIFDHLRF